MLSAVENRVITMEPEEAREQLREYRREIHRRADAEYQAIAEGLEEIAEGRRLVDVREAIIAGGFHENGLPRLAIARADRRQVRCHWGRGWGDPFALTFDTNAEQGRVFDTLINRFQVPNQDQPEAVVGSDRWGRPEGFAIVPIIPAKVRRDSGVAASYDRHHHILFEVEQWATIRRRTEPDRDPYLLRHLGGDLYVILGAWDLTPLEQAVMAGRRDV